MPPLDTDSQFKFLISCIKHSNAGKVRHTRPCTDARIYASHCRANIMPQIDFAQVANELDIVSKAAA